MRGILLFSEAKISLRKLKLTKNFFFYEGLKYVPEFRNPGNQGSDVQTKQGY